MANANISVEVAYATPTQQFIIPIRLPEFSTITNAIQQSGILKQFPDIDLSQQKVGIFGTILSLDTVLKTGDRVEIYRPLLTSAIEKRFQRVATKRKHKP